MTERELKAAVLALAKASGWMIFHMPADTLRGSQGRGYPDLTLARNGIALWLELKQEDGRVRLEQEAWQRHLPKGTAYIVRPSDLPDVAELLR